MCAWWCASGRPDLCRVHALRRLSLADRATMVPLLAALVDFDSSPATYRRFDQMTALELFQKCVWLLVPHVKGLQQCACAACEGPPVNVHVLRDYGT